MSSELFPRLAFPDTRLAVQVDNTGLDYRALSMRAGGHAKHLADLGVSAGERVGVVTHTAVDTVVALIGNALAGVVSVPLSTKLGNTERSHILRDSGPRVVFVQTPADAEKYPDGKQPTSTECAPPRRNAEGPLLVLYTSGTTGAPKGALIGASQVAANIDGLAAAWQWTDADTVVHALPLFHVHGLCLGLFGSLRVGGALHTVSRFEPKVIASALRAHTGETEHGQRTSMLFAVPTMHHRLADAAETDAHIAKGLASARLLVSGSAGLPVREHRRIEAITGRGVHERYGLTETLICCAVPASGPARPGTVGPPVPGVQLKLVDDARTAIPDSDTSTIGEVAVRGPSVFDGYLGLPEVTAATMDSDGWFYTGDLATWTGDGAIRHVGRRSVDLIKTGGFKVGAGEVEACMLELEGIAEVAVAGLADEDLGQKIVAFVVLRDGAVAHEQEWIDHVASELSPHKRPREVRVLDELPRNAMGKVQKKRLA